MKNTVEAIEVEEIPHIIITSISEDDKPVKRMFQLVFTNNPSAIPKLKVPTPMAKAILKKLNS